MKNTMEQADYYYDDEDVSEIKKLQKSIFSRKASLSLSSGNGKLDEYVDRKWQELSKSKSNRGKYHLLF